MGVSPVEAIEQAIRKSPSISQTTKDYYLLQFKTLLRLAGGSATSLFRSPDRVYAQMAKEYAQPYTRRSLLVVARSLIRHCPKIGEKFPQASLQYAEFLKTDKGLIEVNKRIMNGELSEREKQTYVPWARIRETRDEMEKSTPRITLPLLMLSMYTLIEPMRQDYGDVEFLYEQPKPESSPPKYIVLDKANKTTGLLVLKTYKTAKKYGEFRRQLPPDLVQLIWKSLAEHPRTHLFVDTKGDPFVNRSKFKHWTTKHLRTIFKERRVTINTLRHSYISNLDFNTKTPGELIRTARLMGHSMGMQQTYRRLPSSTEGLTFAGPPQKPFVTKPATRNQPRVASSTPQASSPSSSSPRASSPSTEPAPSGPPARAPSIVVCPPKAKSKAKAKAKPAPTPALTLVPAPVPTPTPAQAPPPAITITI